MSAVARCLLSLLWLSLASSSVLADDEAPLRQMTQAGDSVLSAADSDPRRMGWMQGFPVPPARRIGQPFTDFWQFPKLRWSVCHLRELLPTRVVSRGRGSPRPLGPLAIDDAIAGLDVMDGTGRRHSVQSVIDNTYTDGIVVLHRNQVVYEQYAGCLTPLDVHATMSMTKSVMGLLAEVLLAEGVLDDALPITTWVPELEQTAFAGASLRQVLDMTTGVAFDERYSDPNSDIWKYARASDAMSTIQAGEERTGFLEFLLQLDQLEAPHGERFKYGTINTDVLGWVLSRATDRSIADLVSERLWQPMGAELDAFFKVDALGIAHAGGGFNAGLRDLARLGQVLLNRGRVGATQILPEAAVDAILSGAEQAVPTTGAHTSYWSGYRSMWWYPRAHPGAVAARGVHGQQLYVDPTADLVIARFASHPRPASASIDPEVLPMIDAIRAHVLATSTEHAGALTSR